MSKLQLLPRADARRAELNVAFLICVIFGLGKMRGGETDACFSNELRDFLGMRS